MEFAIICTEQAQSVSFSYHRKAFTNIFLRLLFHLVTDHLNFNPFVASVPILYLLKTPENIRFSVFFRGFIMGALARNKLISFFHVWKCFHVAFQENLTYLLPVFFYILTHFNPMFYFYTPLKTSENIWFFNIFRSYMLSSILQRLSQKSGKRWNK